MASIPIDQLSPNPGQPREIMDDTGLESLATSIRRHGILQPIIVRRSGKSLEIVAGERRWRAARLAGLKEVPVVERESVSDADLLELALLENVQRMDLNAIERARAYRKLNDEFGRSLEDIASGVGLDRATIANTLRLLELAPEIQDAVKRDVISAGHARALLAIPNLQARQELLARIVRDDLSVRDVELVAADSGARRRSRAKTKGAPSRAAWIHELEERWMRRLGARVGVVVHGRRAEIRIHCSSLDELDRVSDLAVGSERRLTDDAGSEIRRAESVPRGTADQATPQ
jgi:ParB family transcriptional regulator, chromosome partitioning protein